MSSGKHDPNELYVLAVISRREIAEALNDAISNNRIPEVKFESNDPRLTTDVCEFYVEALEDKNLIDPEDFSAELATIEYVAQGELA